MNGSIICIGASTGGVEALEKVLAGFTHDCPPTLIVQHILGEFSGSLARRLNRACGATVSEARDAQRLSRGQVIIAPGDDRHLAIKGGALPRCVLIAGPKRSGHRPSVDVLFHSAAASDLHVVAALLTGMGRDGAEGLGAIRAAGGHTLAQDATTSVVFGMPRAAVEIGAAEFTLPLPRIGPKLLRLARSMQSGVAHDSA
ncbi:MAG: CheB methylesterase domain-containing protein [Rhodobacteraceae bacterium]|nr:CheB methylesterase domain-containing protein [Paracoccaceae bacterium]